MHGVGCLGLILQPRVTVQKAAGIKKELAHRYSCVKVYFTNFLASQYSILYEFYFFNRVWLNWSAYTIFLVVNKVYSRWIPAYCFVLFSSFYICPFPTHTDLWRRKIVDHHLFHNGCESGWTYSGSDNHNNRVYALAEEKSGLCELHINWLIQLSKIWILAFTNYCVVHSRLITLVLLLLWITCIF